MARLFSRQTFKGQTIVLDGTIFQECHFELCKLIYRGGEIPILKSNTFVSVNFSLEGPANNTIEFLRQMYGSGARDLIEGYFSHIRSAPTKPPSADH